MQKLRIFRNLWCGRTDKEGGVSFLQFCADVVYGRPLNRFLKLMIYTN